MILISGSFDISLYNQPIETIKHSILLASSYPFFSRSMKYYSFTLNTFKTQSLPHFCLRERRSFQNMIKTIDYDLR